MSELQSKAKEKLRAEMGKSAETKGFSDKIYPYLEKRIDEDEGLAEDIMQEHKSWKKCYDYIVSMARKLLGGKNGPVSEETVYEWSEDYFRKDDKAEAEKEAKAEAARKKKAAEQKEKKAKVEKKTEPKAVPEKKAEPKPKKKEQPKKEAEYEQMDLFSMFS